MPKRATQVILSDQEQEALVLPTKRHRSEQQYVLRARIMLAAAQGRSNAQIARELAITVDTVRLWRDRWVGLRRNSSVFPAESTARERYNQVPLTLT